MTKEGRLARGKQNYERETGRRFLDNSETKEYMATLKEKKKNAKPTK